MKFEIKIIENVDQEDSLSVLLITKSGRYYTHNCKIPLSLHNVISILESSINSCLDECEKDIEKFIASIIEKNQPDLNKLNEKLFGDKK